MNNTDIKPVVVVEGVTKSFKIPLEGSSGLKQKIVNGLKGKKGYRDFTPLKNVSFTVNEGDFLGIVGKNGSGKSTLLKTIAGIYTPNSGHVNITGSLVPFIELGVGFNPELSGRENVYLNGALLGFSHKDVDAMYDDIVDFAELGEFMEERLKNYSSGMQVRLAFSIAIKASGDILLLDEVLAVGDEAFQQKCFDYFDQLKSEKKTVILVTHDMGNVKRFCNRAILIENGSIKVSGSPDEVSNQYLIDNITTVHVDDDEKSNGAVNVLRVEPVSAQLLSAKDSLVFDVFYEMNMKEPVYIGISILKQNLSLVEQNNKKETPIKNGKGFVGRFSISLSDFNPGKFQITAAVFSKETKKLLGFTAGEDSSSFIISNDVPNTGGILTKKGAWISRE